MQIVDQDSPIGMDFKYGNHLGKLKNMLFPLTGKTSYSGT
jgi:hypothetical protein